VCVCVRLGAAFGRAGAHTQRCTGQDQELWRSASCHFACRMVPHLFIGRPEGPVVLWFPTGAARAHPEALHMAMHIKRVKSVPLPAGHARHSKGPRVCAAPCGSALMPLGALNHPARALPPHTSSCHVPALQMHARRWLRSRGGTHDSCGLHMAEQPSCTRPPCAHMPRTLTHGHCLREHHYTAVAGRARQGIDGGQAIGWRASNRRGEGVGSARTSPLDLWIWKMPGVKSWRRVGCGPQEAQAQHKPSMRPSSPA